MSNLAGALYATAAVLLFLAIVACSLRCFVRLVIVKSLGIDDILMLVTLVSKIHFYFLEHPKKNFFSNIVIIINNLRVLLLDSVSSQSTVHGCSTEPATVTAHQRLTYHYKIFLLHSWLFTLARCSSKHFHSTFVCDYSYKIDRFC